MLWNTSWDVVISIQCSHGHRNFGQQGVETSQLIPTKFLEGMQVGIRKILALYFLHNPVNNLLGGARSVGIFKFCATANFGEIDIFQFVSPIRYTRKMQVPCYPMRCCADELLIPFVLLLISPTILRRNLHDWSMSVNEAFAECPRVCTGQNYV